MIQEFLLSEKVVYQPAFVDHPVREGPDDSDNPGQEPLDGLVLEQHVPGPELGQNAAETPHVDFVVVFAADDNFGGPVGPALHVGAQMVVDEAAGPEVDDFHLASAVAFHEDVFGF